MKEFFENKIAELAKNIAEGNISSEKLQNEYNGLINSVNFSKIANLISEEEQQQLVSNLNLCENEFNRLNEEKATEATEAIVGAPVDSNYNVVAVEPEKRKRTTGEKLATAGAVLAAGTVGLGLASASGCFAEKTEENTNNQENENLTDLEKVSSSLSLFINNGLNNGVELTTDEGLMLMYASNIETRIDLGDNITLDQVVLAHYVKLAEDLIANNPEYKGKLVSDVAPELMTNDYHSGLAKINDGFIKYGYIAPTNLLIANENDKKVLSNFEEALKEGIEKNGDFTRANELAVKSYKENTSILSGTQIIMAGQYSAINAYGQNAGIEITGMDKETFDLIFRECGGSVVNTGYEAYTTYMTLVRSTLKVDILRQMSEWNVYVASNDNLEELAQQKYDAIDKFIKENRVKLVTPENVNKERLEEMEKENKEATESLNNRLDQGYELKEDSNGNQFLTKPVTQAQKDAVEKADKEKAEKEAEIKYDEGYKEDSKGNVIDSEGNNLGKPSVGEKPVPDAPVMTEEEIKETEEKAKEELEEEPTVEFIPIDPVVVEETVTTSIDGKVVSQNTYNSNQQTIAELEDLKNQLNSATSNVTETVVTEESAFNPFEEEVTFTPVEGIDENGNLLPGYTIDINGNIVQESVKSR